MKEFALIFRLKDIADFKPSPEQMQERMNWLGTYSQTLPNIWKKTRMIHLIVGNTGSGKTTYSNELKSKNDGIIFSIDKWNNTLFLADKKPTDGLE